LARIGAIDADGKKEKPTRRVGNFYRRRRTRKRCGKIAEKSRLERETPRRPTGKIGTRRLRKLFNEKR